MYDIQQISVGATAGNATKTWTVDTGDKKRILYGNVTLTTDATVANRYVVVQVLDENSNVVTAFHSGAPVAASATSQQHDFLQGVFRETSFVDSSVHVPFATECVIPEGWGVKVSISGGVAGDSFTARFAWTDAR